MSKKVIKDINYPVKGFDKPGGKMGDGYDHRSVPTVSPKGTVIPKSS